MSVADFVACHLPQAIDTACACAGTWRPTFLISVSAVTMTPPSAQVKTLQHYQVNARVQA